MADLVIRYVNGRRVFSIDHGDRRNKLECVLYDATRELRIKLPPDLAALSLSQIEKAMRELWHDDEAEPRDSGCAEGYSGA